MRLDKFLFTTLNLKSRAYAENLIKTGCVFVGGKQILKPAYEVDESDDIQITDNNNYASQGAYKLQEAFSRFSLDVKGKTALDLGCSNGGFTDCLLRHGADKIIAVDVGDCCLPKDILDSGKVTFIKCNAATCPPTLPTLILYVPTLVSYLSSSFFPK